MLTAIKKLGGNRAVSSGSFQIFQNRTDEVDQND